MRFRAFWVKLCEGMSECVCVCVRVCVWVEYVPVWVCDCLTVWEEDDESSDKKTI